MLFSRNSGSPTHSEVTLNKKRHKGWVGWILSTENREGRDKAINNSVCVCDI